MFEVPMNLFSSESTPHLLQECDELLTFRGGVHNALWDLDLLGGVSGNKGTYYIEVTCFPCTLLTTSKSRAKKRRCRLNGSREAGSFSKPDVSKAFLLKSTLLRRSQKEFGASPKKGYLNIDPKIIQCGIWRPPKLYH